MKLVEVYPSKSNFKILYELLNERTQEESISHKSMPTYEDHCEFVTSNPYYRWYLIIDEIIVGSIYLTNQREIGVSVFKSDRGNRYATQAIKLLMESHPGRFLANINPKNAASIALFAKFGAKHIQNTYEF